MTYSDEISEDESDSDSQGDLESDLLAFDKEQADMIRHINKLGSMKHSGYMHDNKFDHPSMQFLSNSVQPLEKRRTQVDDK